MKVEAHNLLHNFLLPLKDRLDKIEAHADAETLNELKSYLSIHNTYFDCQNLRFSELSFTTHMASSVSRKKLGRIFIFQRFDADGVDG